MYILLAEDDRRFGRLIKHMFEKENISVDWVQSGDGVLECVARRNYDILILDWMMPGKDGIQVSRYLRQHGYNGGIFMLTAKD